MPFLTNETLFALPERPGHLVVIGGGPGSFIGPQHRQAARTDDRFEIVAGERRWRACGLANAGQVPAMIRDMTDDEAEDVEAAARRREAQGLKV